MRKLDLIRQGADRGREALITQDHGLEVEGEVPQLTDRCPMTLERATNDLLRLFAATFLDRVQAGIEQQRDSRERLHRTVVQLVCKATSFLLLGCDELIGQPGTLGFAQPRVVEELGILVLPRGEVGQDGCTDDIVPIEGTLTRQPQRADLLLVRTQGNHDRVLRRCLPWPLRRREQQRACLEEPLGLLARPLEHLRAARDRAHRLDERLEEARLARELTLCGLVPPPFRHDQVGRHDSRERDRDSETGEGQWTVAYGQRDHGQDGRRGERQDQQSGSSR